MIEETVNIAGIKKHFSDILGRVAYGKKRILITKGGKPMARLVPADGNDTHLSQAKGWLDNDDPFFDTIERIVQKRSKHKPRVFKTISTE
ncbi:MAG: type II toxin-antitoxin system prevent-host-death family antitoxin [Deltaproteobacteria bacterium]|nr:type II toxin-antitoxin system prevent-host-death family antitoxin [Deltaproteobacteria bacterium]MBW1962350.1 type II toxin-antitoxin system prevent-host-death family antitoxin [Deltaproteobacteria bacterium]MBW1996313.1 type II toxin-antitoxin system prevent-host-death family antitoxin [Deltaproteobacteria bacterium]MBW2153483.1 type II toxin-antitoxin system prevent-host-death family antitoxin [Deltaproteobacteria bacterium]